MIAVDRKLFARALELGGAVTAPSVRNIPVLSHIKITANGALRIEGTDLDNATCAEIPYTGKEGQFLLPSHALIRRAINQAGGDIVTLKAAEDKIQLRAGQLDSNLRSLPVDDFPSIGRISSEEFAATLGAGELKQIRRAMLAMSDEETRYYLNGVNVRKVGDWLYQFAATNGHFLIVVNVPLPDAQGILPDNTIIPRDWLNLIMARLAKAKESVRLTYGHTSAPNTNGPDLVPQRGGRRIAARGDVGGVGYSVAGKLIDGDFPDYTRVIPAEQTFAARFRRADLVQAVSAVSALAFGKFRAVKFSFPAGKMMVEQLCSELGNSKFEIEAEHNVTGEIECIGFNARYLLTALSAVDGEEVVLGLTHPSGPATFTDPADTAFTGVLMPMRV